LLRLISAIVFEHFSDIGPGFPDARDIATLHTVDPRIVGGKRQGEIPFVEVQQTAELFGAASDILDGIVDVGNPQCRRRVRRKLHQAYSSFA